jgi:heme/copper-type cytochrome/quinol oxidase subunit 4
MSIATDFGASNQKSDYEDHKRKMWEAFSRLKVGTRLSILLEESWPFLLFAFGYHVVPTVIAVAHAQARNGQGNHPGIAAIIYIALIVILVACVVFLLFNRKNWGNVHSWAAKTATFLLGFLTKAVQEFS